MNRYVLLGMLFAILMSVSCSQQDGTLPPPLVVEQTQSGMFFIRTQEVLDYDAVRYSGRVSLTDECLRVIDERENESFLVIWPVTTEVIEQDGQVEIIGVHGNDGIRIDDYIVFNGNSYESLPSEWKGLIPDECNEEPYIAIGQARILSPPDPR